MTNYNAKDVVNELFGSLFMRYKIGLKTLMRGSNFVSDSVQLLYFKCHKINFKHGGLYIDYPDWEKFLLLDGL